MTLRSLHVMPTEDASALNVARGQWQIVGEMRNVH